MPVDTLILNGEHLEVVGVCPGHWRPELPIEVYDPWTGLWFQVTSVSFHAGVFLFILAGGSLLRTEDLKYLKVRIKE